MISSQFLSDMANYAEGRVAKVVLNGTFEITSFTLKEVTGNTIALHYLVPVAHITNIDQVELKDASNNILSTNEVDVPITADTLILQTIQIGEGS